MNKQLKIAVLLSLARADGPMPQAAIFTAARLFTGAKLNDGDLSAALAALEADGLLVGLTDELTGASWSLTDAGRHRAAQLR